MADHRGYGITISRFMAEFQEGNLFHVCVYSDTIADDGFLTLALKTPVDLIQENMLQIRARAGGVSVLNLIEGPVLETTGSPFVPLSYNRQVPNSSITSVTAANSHSGGTPILSEMIGFGNGGINASGGLSHMHFTLGVNTSYILNLQNVSGGAAALSLAVDLIDKE